MSSSLFSQIVITKIKRVHKIFLWVATGILIISLLLGAILIFVDTKNDLFTKVQGTFLTVAIAAFICVNNFIRIEKGNKLIQGFALAGFITNVVWLILGILMIWGALSPMQIKTSTASASNASARTYGLYDEYGYSSYYNSNYYDDLMTEDYYGNTLYPTSYTSTTYDITVGFRIFIVALSLATICFWVSNILVIKDRVKVVKPLKITAIVCGAYGSTFMIVMALAWPIIIDESLLKWMELSGLMASGFVVTALAAWIISRTHKDFDSDVAENQLKLVEQAVVVESIDETIVANEKVETPSQSNNMSPSIKYGDAKINETTEVVDNINSQTPLN